MSFGLAQMITLDTAPTDAVSELAVFHDHTKCIFGALMEYTDHFSSDSA